MWLTIPAGVSERSRLPFPRKHPFPPKDANGASAAGDAFSSPIAPTSGFCRKSRTKLCCRSQVLFQSRGACPRFFVCSQWPPRLKPFLRNTPQKGKAVFAAKPLSHRNFPWLLSGYYTTACLKWQENHKAAFLWRRHNGCPRTVVTTLLWTFQASATAL